MLSSANQDYIEVVIPPTFLGIFRDLMITFWNYVIAKLYEQGEKELSTDIDSLKLTKMEYLKFSNVNIDNFCKTLTEIIEYGISNEIIDKVVSEYKKYKECYEIINEINKIRNRSDNIENLIKELDRYENATKCKKIVSEIKNKIKSKVQKLDNFLKNLENNKEILLKLCKFSLSLQKESIISGKTNITVRFGVQDFKRITIPEEFKDIIQGTNKGIYENFPEVENIFQEICKDLNNEYYKKWYRRTAYEFGRGFAIEKSRGKIELEISTATECKLIYEIPIFITVAKKLAEIRIGMHYIYVTTNEIYSGNYEILNNFFDEELKNLKTHIDEMLRTFSEGDEIRRIYDVLQEVLLLKIVNDFLRKSVAYVYNWPSLRIYYLPPPREQGKLTRDYIVIDLPPSLVEIANLAIISSARKLNMEPKTLLDKIFKIIRKAENKGKDTQNKISINELYTLVHTILQGNPDIDLFYKLERESYIIEG